MNPVRERTQPTQQSTAPTITVRDTIYLNRWIEMTDGYVVKFDHQLAQVPETYIGYFQKLKEFEIISPVSDASLVKTDASPAKTK